jgi:hypothetical protein
MLMCSEYARTHGGQANNVTAQVVLLQECIQILPKKWSSHCGGYGTIAGYTGVNRFLGTRVPRFHI